MDDQANEEQSHWNQQPDATSPAITVIEQAEESLRKSEEFNRRLVEASPAGILCMDQSGRITYENPAMQRMMGVPEGAESPVIGLNFFELPPIRDAIAHTKIVNILDGETIAGEVVHYRSLMGSEVDLEVYSAPLSDAHGHPDGVILMALDISERERIQKILEKQVAQLALLSGISRRIASELDVDRLLDQSAHLVQECFGYHHAGVFILDQNRNELVLRAKAGAFTNLFAPDHHLKPGQGMVGWVIQHGTSLLANDVRVEPHYANLYPGVVPTQSELSVPIRIGNTILGVLDVQSRLLNAFDESDVTVMETLTDQMAVAIENARLFQEAQRELTERKLAELAFQRLNANLEQRVTERTEELSAANAALARASRLKDEFLASMSHELRTPLTGVLSLSEALQEQVYGSLNEKQLKSLRTIEDSGQHLLELINDILDFTRIEAGQLELQVGTCSADSVCQSSLLMVKDMAQCKHQGLSYAINPASIELQADPRRLKQMIINLLSNAVKFTQRDGQIGLQVEGDVDMQTVRFCVWDTGIGISAEDYPMLFQPFTQLDSSLARQHSGTGLGLSLVQRMADLHGGSVSVESTPGQGSRFTITLPWRAPAAVTAHPAEAKESVESPPTGPHILLVEDNQLNIDIYSDYLQAKGYRLTVARQGSEAITLALELKPDLILMDIQMPVMSGMEAIRLIRESSDARLASVPIIALTALAMPGDRQRCLAAGANEYLSKPVSLQTLIRAVQTQLSLE